jgi:RimJ/RimL family protein N-acetyltransferase
VNVAFETERLRAERNARHREEHGFGIVVVRERKGGRFVGRGALRRIEIGGREQVEVGYAVAAGLYRTGTAA